ncbi:hypothetical protein D9V32_05595 [Mycetocola tolaasinivorans]|uniref:Uncharacterized protein n=1 Tax=Mycetocola tolaasinivorans TaxID=76635 RepID=A0A3L7A8G1_9MICO|nr:hypothetical protein [Mycetocola tolaasinivorans]RLP76344.1 hypothetical protein D9V32_05595 [Mycetocola tolaasinivorans]
MPTPILTAGQLPALADFAQLVTEFDENRQLKYSGFGDPETLSVIATPPPRRTTLGFTSTVATDVAAVTAHWPGPVYGFDLTIIQIMRSYLSGGEGDVTLDTLIMPARLDSDQVAAMVDLHEIGALNLTQMRSSL